MWPNVKLLSPVVYQTESKNTDAQGTRASATTLYVLRGLQEGVRLYLS